MHHGKTESIQVQMDTVTFSTSDGNKGGTGGKEGENIEDNNAVEEDGGKGSSQCDDDIRKGEKGYLFYSCSFFLILSEDYYFNSNAKNLILIQR